MPPGSPPRPLPLPHSSPGSSGEAQSLGLEFRGLRPLFYSGGGSAEAAEPRFRFNSRRLEWSGGAQHPGSRHAQAQHRPGGLGAAGRGSQPHQPGCWGGCSDPPTPGSDRYGPEPAPRPPHARPTLRPTNAGLRHFHVELLPRPSLGGGAWPSFNKAPPIKAGPRSWRACPRRSRGWSRGGPTRAGLRRHHADAGLR